MQLKSSLTPAALSSIAEFPSASSYSGHIVWYAGCAWYSNGTRWAPMSAGLDAAGSWDMINPTFATLQYLNLSSGTTDLAGPPSGKRWKVSNIWPTAASTIVCKLYLKNSGNYYNANGSVGTNVTSSLTVAGTFVQGNLPILDYGDIVAFDCASAGVNLLLAIEEFEDTSPLKSIKKYGSWTNGNNTIYTCPSNCQARLLPMTLLTGGLGPLGLYFLESTSQLRYVNLTGATRTVYANHVLSGGSPSAPGAGGGSNALMSSIASVLSASTTTLVGGLWYAAGDYLNFNVDSNSSSQFLWANVCEYPLPV